MTYIKLKNYCNKSKYLLLSIMHCTSYIHDTLLNRNSNNIEEMAKGVILVNKEMVIAVNIEVEVVVGIKLLLGLFVAVNIYIYSYGGTESKITDLILYILM